jgi:hypothetical protein
VAKLKLLLFIILGFVILILFGIILFLALKPKVAGIYIDTNPPSEVAIYGEKKGETPYRALLDPGEVTLHLFPKSESPLRNSYETKVTLLPGVETVIRHSFGATYDTSSGEVISFEKIGKNETSLTIVSIPDEAHITIDGTIEGTAPYKTSAISEGEHTVLVSAEGYMEKTVKVKTHKGYKLTAIVTLAKGAVTQTPTPTQLPSPTPIPASVIQILSTPTGTLRVRKEPKTGSEELGEVKSGESYPYLDRDQITGWYKIRFNEGMEGWVSPQYAKKIDNKISVTPTQKVPSLTVTKTPTSPF